MSAYLKNILLNKIYHGKQYFSVIKNLEAITVKPDEIEDASFRGTVVKWDRISVQL